MQVHAAQAQLYYLCTSHKRMLRMQLIYLVYMAQGIEQHCELDKNEYFCRL